MDGDNGRRPGRLPKTLVAGFVVGTIASILWIGTLGYAAIQMVRSGRGLGPYLFYGDLEFSLIGFLVLLGVLPLALLVGLGFSFREHRQWRSLEKKYGARDRKT